MAQKMYKITEIYEDISVYYVLASSKKEAQEKIYHKRDFMDPDESDYKHLSTRIEEVEDSNENSSSS